MIRESNKMSFETCNPCKEKIYEFVYPNLSTLKLDFINIHLVLLGFKKLQIKALTCIRSIFLLKTSLIRYITSFLLSSYFLC